MKQDIKKTVKHIIAKHLGIEEKKVKDSSNLSDDLGADSLDVVELVMAVETEFDIEIPDRVIENIKTVQDIITYLKENK